MKNKFYAPIIISILSITGCFSPVKMPTLNQYFFNPNIETINTKSTPYSLLVTTPIAAAGYKSYKMAYIRKPSELYYYTRNRWVSPPAEMLQPLLVESIQRSHRFKAVVSAPFTGKADYRLDTEIVYLRQNLTTPSNQSEMAIQVRLIDNFNQRIIASRMIQQSAEVPQLMVYHSVLITNIVLEKLLAEITHFVIMGTADKESSKV